MAHKRKPEWAASLSKSMKSNNPMRSAEIRAKVSNRLRFIHHHPKIRGGNGTGPTRAEQFLLTAFPEAVWNYPIPTGKRSGSGYPTNYKVDLGFPGINLAIEADGPCHTNWDQRKAKDMKKDSLLKELGWTVLRITNRLIMEHPLGVLLDIRSTISKLKDIRATASMA